MDNYNINSLIGWPLFWFHAQAGLPECRLTARQSRNGARFRCISCGMEFHADINAAINV